MTGTARRLLVAAGVPAAAAAVVGTSRMFDPSRGGLDTGGCPFRALTGHDCPGCGTSRAISAFADGRFVDAADHNVAAVVVITSIVVWWLAVTAGKTAPRIPRLGGRSPALVVGAAIGIWWVIRLVAGRSSFLGSGL